MNVQRRVYKSRFGVNRIYISHFAVSDIAGKRFLFSDKTDAGVYGFAGAKDDRLHVWTGRNVLDGTIGKMHIRASDGDKAIDLQLTPVKPVSSERRKWIFKKIRGIAAHSLSLFLLYESGNRGGTENGQ